jgi:hypothetical protein
LEVRSRILLGPLGEARPVAEELRVIAGPLLIDALLFFEAHKANEGRVASERRGCSWVEESSADQAVKKASAIAVHFGLEVGVLAEPSLKAGRGDVVLSVRTAGR